VIWAPAAAVFSLGPDWHEVMAAVRASTIRQAAIPIRFGMPTIRARMKEVNKVFSQIIESGSGGPEKKTK
jgi:hypothetical protein